ncbi:MAG TPA: cysteine--tRNA ligase [Candidatus Saccharimonadales bacterium]|nr:cysteine--tRNA ligase [Candidatus Saccharimonadales bacterium]
MKLYNTLTRQIEEIQPQQPPVVTVYTCGPTVYDYAHIGHWFTYVRMDTLIRTLKATGLNPTWVMNITDVGHLVSDADEGEDKLEKGARREGKTAWEIAEFYTEDFLAGMQTLHILRPDHVVKATDHIKEQIALIQKLEMKGYTYIIDDGVYYDTSKFEGYGRFAQLDLDEQQASGRVAPNPQKRQASDFALWKFSPPDKKRDMEWDSPWGLGFPGWHIECSAMSMKYLGDTLDIHTGGIDHVPVHHTNEIAQSEAATGKRFANYWMHTNHVMVDGQKISKSLGNGITLQDITKRGIPPEAIRLHILESHYRSQSRFSWESLEAATNRLRDFKAMAALRWQPRAVTYDTGTIALEDVVGQVKALLENDLDTPQALAFLSEACAQILAVLVEENMTDHLETMIRGLDELLGLNLGTVQDITDAQKALIQKRAEAREKGDWASSDTIRDELENQGVGLRDTPEGTIWFPL